MSLQDSILKEILLSKGCSIGKYLSPMFCNDEKGTFIEYYITPVVSISKKNILIISKRIRGNWYQALLNIETIVNNIKKQYRFSTDTYSFILHAYFDVVALENFYLVDIENKYMLRKLKMLELEDLLT